MRVTNSMYYDSIYGVNNHKLSNELFDVNKQISSGLSIQYASDDVRTFSDTMRLDNEITTFSQIKKSTDNGLKVSTQTDSVLNEFTTNMDRVKTLLIQASNDTQSQESRDAIAKELRGIEENFKSLANTSVNGRYLFSGSKVDVKPIDENGIYHGNDASLEAFLGSNNTKEYNISGAELFLGDEPSKQKRVTTNVAHYNQIDLNTSIGGDGVERPITASSTIRELVGDIDDDETNDPVSHFYIKGVKSSGEGISAKIDLNSDNTVGDLMSEIEELYGANSVNVTLNSHGEIEIQDKMSGSSKLDFYMVGATDFNIDGNGVDDADVTTSSDLADSKVHLTSFVEHNYSLYGSATNTSIPALDNKDAFSINGLLLSDGLSKPAEKFTPLEDVLSSTTETITLSGVDVNGNAVSVDFDPEGKTVNDLLVAIDDAFDNTTDDTLDTYNSLNVYLDSKGKIRINSNSDTSSSNLDINMTTKDAGGADVPGIAADRALVYDDAAFTADGDRLTSNVSQIVTDTNAYADARTKLSEVADLSKGNVNTLDGTKYKFEGTMIDGHVYEATINLKSSANGGSDFTVKVDSDGDGVVDTDDTYDIFNMENPRTKVDADEMTYQQFMDVINVVLTDQLPTTKDDPDDYDQAVENASYRASTELTYDGKLSFEDKTTANTKASISLYDDSGESTLSFMRNSALTIEDSKTDFFKTLDMAIKAVENNTNYPDAVNNDPETVGMQNAIQMIDDLSSHLGKVHSKVGAQSNTLNTSLEITTMLETSTITLRSSVIDTDLAEASLRLTQLDTNYQAMLATVGKVSQLSLVNYL